MSSAYQNLSSYDFDSVPDGTGMKIAVVVAEWNSNITERLLEGACDTLEKHGVAEPDIFVERVPGSVELIFGAKQMAETNLFDGVIILGCVVRGETPHFDYVCSSVTQGLTELNLRYDIPFIFGMVTTNDMAQAKARSGGKFGNKGVEAAVTVLKMIDFNRYAKALR